MKPGRITGGDSPGDNLLEGNLTRRGISRGQFTGGGEFGRAGIHRRANYREGFDR